MKFQLRAWELTDAPKIVPLANNPQVAGHLRNTFPYPYTLDDAHLFILKTKTQFRQKQISQAIVIDNQVAGSISLLRQDDIGCKSGELGFWLGESYWGKGITTQSIIELCKSVFSGSDLMRIYARPFSENSGARRALEKAGFQLEGTFKKSVYKNSKLADSCMYALVR